MTQPTELENDQIDGVRRDQETMDVLPDAERPSAPEPGQRRRVQERKLQTSRSCERVPPDGAIRGRVLNRRAESGRRHDRRSGVAGVIEQRRRHDGGLTWDRPGLVAPDTWRSGAGILPTAVP